MQKFSCNRRKYEFVSGGYLFAVELFSSCSRMLDFSANILTVYPLREINFFVQLVKTVFFSVQIQKLFLGTSHTH